MHPSALRPAALVAVLFPLRSLGWPGGGTAKPPSPAVQGREASVDSLQDFLEGMKERTLARAQDPSLRLPSNPSCFLLALSSLPSSSSACESLAHSDTLRSETAAKMAMCEIRTAEGGKVPRECEDWEKGKRGEAAGCIEALSRSPQYWSSYSGYLREIVSTCSAFRRWADVEFAKDLNEGTARRMSAFVEELRDFEWAREGREVDKVAAGRKVQQDLDALLASLTSLSSSLAVTSASQASDLGTVVNSFEHNSAALANQLSGLDGAVKELVEKVGKEMAMVNAEVKVALMHSVVEHDSRLTSIATDVDDQLAASLDVFAARQAQLVTGLDDLALTAQTADASLRMLNSVGILGLQTLSETLASALSGSVSSAALLERQLASLHADSLGQAHQLAAVLANLSSLAEQQQAGFLERRSDWTDGLGWEEVMWLVQVLWGPTLRFFSRHPVSIVAMWTLYFGVAYGRSNPPFTALCSLAVLMLLGKLRLSPFRLSGLPKLRFLSFSRTNRRSARSSPVSAAHAVRFALPSLTSIPTHVPPPAHFTSLLTAQPMGEEVSRARRFARAASAPL